MFVVWWYNPSWQLDWTTYSVHCMWNYQSRATTWICSDLAFAMAALSFYFYIAFYIYSLFFILPNLNLTLILTLILPIKRLLKLCAIESHSVSIIPLWLPIDTYVNTKMSYHGKPLKILYKLFYGQLTRTPMIYLYGAFMNVSLYQSNIDITNNN